MQLVLDTAIGKVHSMQSTGWHNQHCSTVVVQHGRMLLAACASIPVPPKSIHLFTAGCCSHSSDFSQQHYIILWHSHSQLL